MHDISKVKEPLRANGVLPGALVRANSAIRVQTLVFQVNSFGTKDNVRNARVSDEIFCRSVSTLYFQWECDSDVVRLAVLCFFATISMSVCSISKSWHPRTRYAEKFTITNWIACESPRIGRIRFFMLGITRWSFMSIIQVQKSARKTNAYQGMHVHRVQVPAVIGQSLSTMHWLLTSRSITCQINCVRAAGMLEHAPVSEHGAEWERCMVAILSCLGGIPGPVGLHV